VPVVPAGSIGCSASDTNPDRPHRHQGGPNRWPCPRFTRPASGLCRPFGFASEAGRAHLQWVDDRPIPRAVRRWVADAGPRPWAVLRRPPAYSGVL